MKKNILFFIFLIAVIVASSLIYLHEGFTQDDRAVVIINKSQKNLTPFQIKKIFKGVSKKFPNGKGIRVLLNSNDSINKEFSRKFLNISLSQFNQSWIKKNMRDGSPIPRKVSSIIAITLIKNSLSFIGVIKKSEATPDVKVFE